jgi:hypothetical protein
LNGCVHVTVSDWTLATGVPFRVTAATCVESHTVDPAAYAGVVNDGPVGVE